MTRDNVVVVLLSGWQILSFSEVGKIQIWIATQTQTKRKRYTMSSKKTLREALKTLQDEVEKYKHTNKVVSGFLVLDL